jgi:replication factor C subunit 3/5
MNKILDFGENDKLTEDYYTSILKEDENNVMLYNLPWIEKYRPNNFEEIVSHTDIINALDRMIVNNSLPHLMFYGPPGIGKTTTIMACAKKMYGSNYKNMILELNGSEDRGINVVRDQIKEFSVSKQFICRMSNSCNNDTKLVILDEADSMTSDAQFALRRVIENHTNNTRFCIICNYETKIISALKSRCMIFRFSPILKSVHIDKIKYICEEENVQINDDAINTIVELAEGDMRKSINLLQAINTTHKFGNKIIDENNVFRQIGYPTKDELKILMDLILEKKYDLVQTVMSVNKLKIEYGLTNPDILKQIVNFLSKNITKTNTLNIIKIFNTLGTLENYMSISYNENLMLANIIGCIKVNLSH